MSSSTVETRSVFAVRVEVTDDTLSVELTDGRTIGAPLAWYPVWLTVRGRKPHSYRPGWTL
jgi:hypothetical protein